MQTKYEIIGSEAQVAMTETRGNLNKARQIFKPTNFSNGPRALVITRCGTKRDAQLWLERSRTALAFVSGRIGRWIAPTFTLRAS